MWWEKISNHDSNRLPGSKPIQHTAKPPILQIYLTLQGFDKRLWKQYDISDMALFTGVLHLSTFNIVVPLIYHLLPNVWKASYTIRTFIFVDVPHWPPYSTDKLISCVVPGPSQWFFHFGEESTPVVQWLSYSPLDPRFAGSIPAWVDRLFQSVKILSMTSFGREVKPRVPCSRFTARKRASGQNLSDFSRSISEATLMT